MQNAIFSSTTFMLRKLRIFPKCIILRGEIFLKRETKSNKTTLFLKDLSQKIIHWSKLMNFIGLYKETVITEHTLWTIPISQYSLPHRHSQTHTQKRTFVHLCIPIVSFLTQANTQFTARDYFHTDHNWLMRPAHISHSSFKENFDTGHLLESSKTIWTCSLKH